MEAFCSASAGLVEITIIPPDGSNPWTELAPSDMTVETWISGVQKENNWDGGYLICSNGSAKYVLNRTLLLGRSPVGWSLRFEGAKTKGGDLGGCSGSVSEESIYATKAYVDFVIRTFRTVPMGSVSRSDFFHQLVEKDGGEAYQYFDIKLELTDPFDESMEVPGDNDEIFSLTSELLERSQKRRIAKGEELVGTQELMKDKIKSWKPQGKVINAFCEVSPMATFRPDIIVSDDSMSGELSIMTLLEMKRRPGAEGIHLKEFSPEEKGQVIEFGYRVLQKQPWRSHVYVGLSDTRRFMFFKVTHSKRLGFLVHYSAIFMDARGWELLRLLFSQSPTVLGYQQVSVEGFAIGPILGVGGTAVVAECVSALASEDIHAVAKLYTGEQARQYRNQEAAALQALQGIPHIPSLVENAPASTASGHPVLLKRPRGHSAGDGVYPLIRDYAPLVSALKAVHDRGWLHNDVAPANIFFKTADGAEVFLNDFGSATDERCNSTSRASGAPAPPKSRPLFYRDNDTSDCFDFGKAADLRALVLSIFVLTRRNAFNPSEVATRAQLEQVAMRAQPWTTALAAARVGNYEGVRLALKSDLQ